MKVYIDINFVLIGIDKVVCYIVVIKIEGGVVNVMYEGMCCEIWEKKIYVFGYFDGKWLCLCCDKWQLICDIGVNCIDGVLFKDYFCEGKIIVDNENVKSIVNCFKMQMCIDFVWC